MSKTALSTFLVASFLALSYPATTWAAMMQAAQPTPTAKVKPAPTACDLAVQAVEQNAPADLSFSDKEFILSKANCSPANKTAADKVWQSIQDMQKGGATRLKIPVKVIAANKESIEVAIADDNQASNKVDMHVVMEKPMLHPPAPGAMIDVIGIITKYLPDPFMFTMEKGELPASQKPVATHN